MNKHNLLESVKCLSDFLDERECGESYWTDDEGRRHNAGIGYVSEFLNDLLLYLDEGQGRKQPSCQKCIFNYNVSYRYITDMCCSEIFCENWEKKMFLDADAAIVATAGLASTIISLPKVAWLQVTDLRTDKVVFTYDGPQ